jgi:hypothetical protein
MKSKLGGGGGEENLQTKDLKRATGSPKNKRKQINNSYSSMDKKVKAKASLSTP